jgi:hypothetical protein
LKYEPEVMKRDVDDGDGPSGGMKKGGIEMPPFI